jgi:hypothetical protein
MALKVVGHIYEVTCGIVGGRYLCDSKETVQSMIARLMDLPMDSEEVINVANGNSDYYTIKEHPLYDCTTDDDPERVDIIRR